MKNFKKWNQGIVVETSNLVKTWIFLQCKSGWISVVGGCNFCIWKNWKNGEKIIKIRPLVAEIQLFVLHSLNFGAFQSALIRNHRKNHFSWFLSLFSPKMVSGDPLTPLWWNVGKIRAPGLLDKRMITAMQHILVTTLRAKTDGLGWNLRFEIWHQKSRSFQSTARELKFGMAIGMSESDAVSKFEPNPFMDSIFTGFWS